MQKDEDTVKMESATIESAAGMRVTVLNLGATIAAIELPTEEARRNVVLSYLDRQQYKNDRFCLGTTVGPFANRIRGGRFKLAGQHFALEVNEPATGHCLHSGSSGLHRQVFAMSRDATGRYIECRVELPDGLGGFPGNRNICVEYQLVSDYCLVIDFRATSDRDTVISLANHSYFNLGGPLADHELSVCADRYTPVDDTRIPTGEMLEVEGSAFDLRRPTSVGDKVFDHNFVLPASGNEPHLAATLRSPATGLQLDLLTTQPGLQLYTGDFLSKPFIPRQGLCLEAQGFPDAPNHPQFPSTLLTPGSTYWQRTIYEFSTRKGSEPF